VVVRSLYSVLKNCIGCFLSQYIGQRTKVENKAPVIITKQKSKLLDSSGQIMTNFDVPESEKAFLTRQLVQVTLPHRNPGNVPVWKRTNGNLTLSIRPGWDNKQNKPIGFPYGSIPRLLLFWITTEALRVGSRRLELGDSLAAFMRDVGLDPNRGGKNSPRNRLRNQMERLFRAIISFETNIETEKVATQRWMDMQVAPDGELWWDPKNHNQSNLFDSWIELGDKFYQAITTAPVPLDKRALTALKQSPLALDLYVWSTYKSHVVSINDKKQFIPWGCLAKQMGCDYARSNDFKQKSKTALRKILLVYPALKIESADGGINVLPSSLPSVRLK